MKLSKSPFNSPKGKWIKKGQCMPHGCDEILLLPLNTLVLKYSCFLCEYLQPIPVLFIYRNSCKNRSSYKFCHILCGGAVLTSWSVFPLPAVEYVWCVCVCVCVCVWGGGGGGGGGGDDNYNNNTIEQQRQMSWQQKTSPVTGEFPTRRPVTRSFDVFFHLCLNKRLSKQSWGWWFETP